MKDFEKPIDEMNLVEKDTAYAHMLRNCNKSLQDEIEVSGPLSDDPFIRRRQGLYRAIIAERHGVVYTDKPGGIMHHPV